MLTNNFYDFLKYWIGYKNTFSINMNSSYQKMFRTYAGEEPNTKTFSSKTYSYFGGSFFSATNFGSTSTRNGIPDNITDESDLISTNSFKQSSNEASDELDSTVTYYGNGSTYMILGSGTTKPKKTDYKLESFIGSDVLQCIACSSTLANGSIESDDTEFLMRKTWTFKNISNSAVTVKETGILIAGPRDDSTSTVYAKVLLARDILDSPVTIAPNQIYTFTFNLNC